MREFERLHLQRKLFIDDGRDLGARRDAVALPDIDADDRAADARAGDEQMDRLDRGDHRLAVIDLARMNGKLLRRGRGGDDGGEEQGGREAHVGDPGTRALDL